jgi:uncharacterized protein
VDEMDEMELLIVGIHTRPAVFSAKRLGYRVFSVDYFGDIDLKEKADASLSIVNQRPYRSNGRISDNYSDEKLIALAKRFDADKTILTSTLTSPLDIKKKVIGTSQKRMKKIKDKEYQLKKVERLGIKIPKSEFVDSEKEAIEAAKNIGLPCILKPVRGGGGKDVLYVKNFDEIRRIHEIQINERYVVQEFVKGRSVSASTLSTKNESKGISTSTQILGSRLLNQKGFIYCGSIVPWKNDDVLLSLAGEISKEFGVLGWNGIDFVAGGSGADSDDDYTFIELNPRFQGTFDCIEKVYGINLIDAHTKACEGELMEWRNPVGAAVRMTLYAKERLEITKDLRKIGRDVPIRHSIIEKGEPITTVITHGPSKRASITNAKIKTADIYSNFVKKCALCPGTSAPVQAASRF